jgi:hypothetical protein
MHIEILFRLVTGDMTQIRKPGRLGMDDFVKVRAARQDLVIMYGQVGIKFTGYPFEAARTGGKLFPRPPAFVYKNAANAGHRLINELP